MNRRKSKSVAVISLSSSSSSCEVVNDSPEVDEGEEGLSSRHPETDSDEEDDEVSIYSPSEDNDSEISGTYDGDQEDDPLYNRVIDFLQGNGEREVKKVTLNALRVYLRRHGLRITGTKEVCLARIQEHWKIKDGKAEILYPTSSFTIDCKGDVCKGDAILFTQKVHKRGREINRLDKVKRCGEDNRTRTVAGRVVKESYGAAKQQHTFTVEVFWSEGANKLPALFPLLVKGRNLYRIQTFRQPWKDEAQRKQVLDEKHKRGALARHIRDMRLGRAQKKTNSSNYGHPSRSLSLVKAATGMNSPNWWMSCAEQLSGLHLENDRPPKQAATKGAMGLESTISTRRNGNESKYAPITAHAPRPQSSHPTRSTSCPPRTKQWNVWVRTDQTAQNKMSCAEQSTGVHLQNDNYRGNGKGVKFQNRCWSPGRTSHQQFRRGQNVWIRTDQRAQNKMSCGEQSNRQHRLNDNGRRNGNGAKFQDTRCRPAALFADVSHQRFYGHQRNQYTNYRQNARPLASPEHVSRPTFVNPYGYGSSLTYYEFHGSPPSGYSGLGRPYDQESMMGFHHQGGFFKCSRKGCVHFMRSEGCAASACWRCCLRSGTRCRVHHR